MDNYDVWEAIIRFFHIGAGIAWIGLLYYFNFVQVPSFAKMDPAARSNAIQILVPRALLWFRWAALTTFVLGVAWIGLESMRWEDQNVPGSYWESDAFKSIAIGGGLGTIMLLNVWGIIWPNQKKIIAAVTAAAQGTPAPAEMAQWGRTALLASRVNFMLSIPMLFFMGAGSHFK